ncbi:MAG TPA: DPP IV N-terminal domain-containing protein, partial [Planctomycetota bacterium]|nr:DPP IV N-terminal domain-containing protein [Planctomycetota bacterium]
MRRHTAVLLLATLAPAQRVKDLQLRDLLLLDYSMLFPYEEPKGFVDAANYLVFDAGRDQADGKKSWWSVAARTGARTLLCDREHLEQALQDAGVAAGALPALDDADHWRWNGRHDRVAVEVGDALFVADSAGKARRLLPPPGEVHGTQFSPDGQWLACVHQHELALVPAAGGEVRALTAGGSDELLFGELDWVYQEEVYGRGNFQGFWWSPDSKHIALLRLDQTPVQAFALVADAPARPLVERTKYPKTGEPNPKADLGIADVAGGTVRWFELPQYPIADRLIVRVTWAPDGKEVFFQVQNRTQTFVDLLAGDAETGAVRRVFHEASDCWVEPGPEPKFLAGGAEFLWLSERDGCCHVYRYGRDGKLLGRLTEG